MQDITKHKCCGICRFPAVASGLVSLLTCFSSAGALVLQVAEEGFYCVCVFFFLGHHSACGVVLGSLGVPAAHGASTL